MHGARAVRWAGRGEQQRGAGGRLQAAMLLLVLIATCELLKETLNFIRPRRGHWGSLVIIFPYLHHIQGRKHFFGSHL